MPSYKPSEITLPTRCISLWQPWASAVALGLKTIETRNWETKYRGLIAIHAALQWSKPQQQFFHQLRTICPTLQSLGNKPPLGAIVAVARIADCKMSVEVFQSAGSINQALGDYTHGRFAWLLSDITPIVPLPYKGRQGMFSLPALIAQRAVTKISDENQN